MAQILFPLFSGANDRILIPPIANPRAASVEEIYSPPRTAIGVRAEAVESVQVAVAEAKRITPKDGIIIATGSVYLIGAVREVLTIESRRAEVTNSPTRAFLLRWLTWLVFIPLIALFTAGFGCVSLLCSLWDRSGRQQHAIAAGLGPRHALDRPLAGAAS